MASGKLNFDNSQWYACNQGSTFSFSFVWEDINGNIIDPSNYTFKMQVRRDYGKELLIELSSANNRIFIDSNLAVNMYISPTDTNLFKPGDYIYDLEVTNINDATDIKRLLEGRFLVTAQVTT